MRCATKGPGRHDPWMPNDSIDVPAGEVYVTLDTRGFTGGSLTTYGLQNKGDRLVLASQKEHARS